MLHVFFAFEQKSTNKQNFLYRERTRVSPRTNLDGGQRLATVFVARDKQAKRLQQELFRMNQTMWYDMYTSSVEFCSTLNHIRQVEKHHG